MGASDRLERPRFYHQTTSERWAEIQREGVLWGSPLFWRTGEKGGYRYTYLSPTLFYDDPKFDVVLEVEYTPVGIDGPDGVGIDNYGFDPPEGMHCFQFSVFVPIPLSQVRVIDPATMPPPDELIAASRLLKPPAKSGGPSPSAKG